MFGSDEETAPQRERRIRGLWEEEGVAQELARERADGPLYTLYDGPPFATGLPHYGHLLASAIKDVFPRYKAMQGYRTPRHFGWDTHGLPIEMEVEKELGLAGPQAIERFGMARFNESCRKVAARCEENWKETVWWVFGKLWKRGLIYRGYRLMPFSAGIPSWSSAGS